MALGGLRTGQRVLKQLRETQPTCLQAMLVSGHYHSIQVFTWRHLHGGLIAQSESDAC